MQAGSAGTDEHGGPPSDAHEPVTGTPVDERTSRLAELVTGLTGCPPSGALHVLRTDDEPAADALELVARAMVRVDAPPDPHLRVGGHLRDDDGGTGRADPRPPHPAATSRDDVDEGDEDGLRPPPWLDRDGRGR